MPQTKANTESLQQLDETGTRKGGDRRQENKEVKVERRKVQRRRQIDPTTCERDYNNDEIEFMQALDAYKRRSGRMFPTCSEILEVIRDLGYQKIDQAAELIEIEEAGAEELIAEESCEEDDASELMIDA